MKCECVVCLNDMWMLTPLLDDDDPLYDPLFTNVTTPFMCPVDKFKKLKNYIIKCYEQQAIAFLEKYEHYHPCHETISVQEILFTIWNFFGNRYDHNNLLIGKDVNVRGQ